MNPQDRAMAASVRLKVEDAKGHSLGSGTIIDTHGSEAMIITCGHIFRDSQGQGRISVDLFHPQPRTVEGKLLEYDLKRDIALITISAGPGLTTAAVAPEGLQLQKGDAAFSIGCDRGQDPSLRPTQISGLNRYQGPPNVEAKGQPVDGRSGGGLFSRDGHLIGVCNAADPADDEGIYAAMGTIHWQLAKVGLEQLYKQNAPADLMAEENPINEAASRLAEVGRDVPEFSSRNAAPAAVASASTNAGAGDTEIICIVRSKSNPSAKGQVIHIAHASPELLKQLASNSSDPTLAADLAMPADGRSALSPIPTAGPVVRGQSRR
jgi:S1-C subfamily serine protease